jgi:hypothetical protein
MSDRSDRARERQDNLRPESENQASAMRPPEDVIELGAPGESMAGESADTGAGTGGATETDGRARHNEGTHLGNEPNS